VLKLCSQIISHLFDAGRKDLSSNWRTARTLADGRVAVDDYQVERESWCSRLYYIIHILYFRVQKVRL
jgi:hypothetical protein